MLFPNALHEGLRDGTITLTVRRWTRPQAKVGGRYKTGGGLLEVTAIDVVPAAAITDADARRCGSADRAALFAVIGVSSDDDLVHRIELHRVGEVPADPLPLDADLAADDVADLTRRLDRMGDWALETLRLIEAHPARRAGDLADLVGRERLPFKVDVRKLKRLGLTESLEVGYRLSPRGEAYLRRRSRRGSNAATDAEVLREGAYATADNLRDRAAIYAYRTEPFALEPWVVEQVPWPTGVPTLDVACGPGRYGGALAACGASVTAVDLSEGMVREARATGLPRSAVADAQHLPFPDATFGRVLAAHMMYHLPDPERGAVELARVLRSDGALLVVTNGADHLRELREAMGGAGGIAAPVSENFLLDEAGRLLLDAAFDEVELVRHVGRIEVPEAAPVIRYAASCRALDEPVMRVPWDEMMMALGRAVEAEIAASGCFSVTTDTGVFRCARPRR